VTARARATAAASSSYPPINQQPATSMDLNWCLSCGRRFVRLNLSSPLLFQLTSFLFLNRTPSPTLPIAHDNANPTMALPTIPLLHPYHKSTPTITLLHPYHTSTPTITLLPLLARAGSTAALKAFSPGLATSLPTRLQVLPLSAISPFPPPHATIDANANATPHRPRLRLRPRRPPPHLPDHDQTAHRPMAPTLCVSVPHPTRAKGTATARAKRGGRGPRAADDDDDALPCCR
jgi:hypothetical protein